MAEGEARRFARPEGAGAGCALATAQSPHTPGRTVENRFCEDEAQIEVVRVRLVREPHGVGKGIVPGALVFDWVTLRITGRQRLDQSTLRRSNTTGQCERSAGRIIGAGERHGLAGWVLQLPRKVVVWPDRVGDAPTGHGTVRVPLQRLLEAGDRFLMMVAKAPVEATVEPTLGVRRSGGDLSGISTEFIGIIHLTSLSVCCELATPAGRAQQTCPLFITM